MSDVLAMGGHGLYVWLAYGASLMVLGWAALAPLLALRRMRRRAMLGESEPE